MTNIQSKSLYHFVYLSIKVSFTCLSFTCIACQLLIHFLYIDGQGWPDLNHDLYQYLNRFKSLNKNHDLNQNLINSKS